MHALAKRRRQRDERAAAAVEFALVTPLLLLLVFGIINFGVLFAQDLALSNAARQAARYGVVETRSCDDVIAEANTAAAPLVSGATIVISRPLMANCSGTTKPCEESADKDNLTVTMTYTADVPIGGFIPGLGSTKELTAKGVFRCEWS